MITTTHACRLAALTAALLAAMSMTGIARAEPAADGFWQTPALPGYGRMHNLPQAAYRPVPGKVYKVVFSMTSGAKHMDQVNPALDRVARTVNLYAASGDATPLVLDNAHYHAQFGVDNPNLPEIAMLRKAGVDIAACGQAVAEHGYDYAWIDNSVTLSLSALTTVTTLENQGYAFLPL